jgi:type I restriction enzyme, S subunit
MENELPKGWELRKLGDVMIIERGGSPRPIKKYITNSPDGINWIKISDATASDKYIFQTQEKITQEGLSKTRLVNEGDFILSNSMSFGRPYIMKTTGCIHDGWLVLRNKPEFILDKEFLYYLLSSPLVYQQFNSLAAGSTVRNLNIGLVKSVKIPIPPLKTQKQIVAKLDAFFKEYATLKEEKEKAKENYEKILQSAIMKLLFQEAETNKWDIKNLPEVTEIIMGQSPPSSSYNQNKEGLPFFQGKKEFGKQYPSVVQWCSNPSKIAEKDDILLSVRAPVGPVNIATEKCCIGRGLTAIRAKETLDKEYLYYFMKGNELNLSASGRGSTFDSISRKDIDMIRIPVPPTKNIQKELVKKIKLLSNVEDDILNEQVSIEKNVNMLPHSVLTKAFAGELV